MKNIEKLLLLFAAEDFELKNEYLDISQRLAYDEQKRENEIYIMGMRDCYKLIKLLEKDDN